MPDILGYRERIGIIVQSTNPTVGPECEQLRVPDVTCHIGRVTIKERSLGTAEAFFEHMTTMHEGMGTHRPDHEWRAFRRDCRGLSIVVCPS